MHFKKLIRTHKNISLRIYFLHSPLGYLFIRVQNKNEEQSSEITKK